MMKFTTSLGAASMAALLFTASATFADVIIKDSYVRSSTPSAKTGAAFMTLVNHGDTDDRLIAVRSDIAKRVELHTHTEDANGVMKMTEIEAGIPLPAGEMHRMKRGGDHVMFMGLSAPLVQGEEITVTLTFEQAGEVQVTIPVNHTRRPRHGDAKQIHDTHNHDG